MSLRSTLMRIGISTVGTALVALSVTGTAVAGDGPGRPEQSQLSKGRVTSASGLLLRDAPNRGGAVIRTAAFGEIVTIFCKTPGETIDGNPLWYLLTDGTWAWGAARFIDNIGPAPRWCQ